jgi:predicted amidohydrolase
MNLRIAGAQIPVTKDVEKNLATISAALDFAINEGADILLTPEGSLSGYINDFDQTAVENALDTIITKAKGKLGLALGTCFFEKDGKCYDQIRFYDKKGRFLGFHSKILLCSTLTVPLKGEIKNYGVRPLKTFNFEGNIVGGLICNDMWANPNFTYMPDTHLSQKLARKGAKIIFHAVNGGRDPYFSQDLKRNFHESNLRMRARAGNLWIATVDNCEPQDIMCSSPGGIISPEGVWVVQLPPQGEHCFVHTINI